MQKWVAIRKLFKLKPLKLSYAVENYKFKFGQYKGIRLQDAEDTEYLDWYRDIVDSKLDKKIVDTYLHARRLYGRKFPDHFHEKQFTKWIMAQREKDIATRRDNQHDQLLINEY